jgi:trigger factor
MQTTVERINPVECRVRVQIPWADVKTRLDQKMRDLQRRARVPGFRAGKVPPAVVERMFGNDMRNEVARDLVQETFQTAVAQIEETPLTQPVVEETSLRPSEDFTYAARFEVKPRVEPKDYEGVEVRRRPAVVDPTKVDAILERKRGELTEIAPLPEDHGRTELEAGDVITADVKGTFGDEEVKRKDVQIEIGAAAEFLPGIGAALIEQVKIGDIGETKRITFRPPQENLKPQFKDKDAVLDLALREVRRKVVPELDDEFARDTGDAQSMEELRAKLTEQVLQEDKDAAEMEARRRLVDELLRRNPFEPAPSMISRELAAQVELTKRQFAAQGLRLEQLGTNERELAARLRPQAAWNVRAFLLLEAIGDAHDLVVTDEELDGHVKEMAEEQGQNPQRLRATMEKNNQLLLLRHQIREDKILGFLMDKAKVTEAPDPEPAETPAGADADAG